ncbi:MAG: hypothetical protein IT523_11765 [Burkholderiales bacterium]|nr:hypothetical protein [Burkholderiales bacterium]
MFPLQLFSERRIHNGLGATKRTKSIIEVFGLEARFGCGFDVEVVAKFLRRESRVRSRMASYFHNQLILLTF